MKGLTVIKKVLSVVAGTVFLLSLGAASSTVTAGVETIPPHCQMAASCW
ncbi:hypothetical protein [Kribbella sp. NPDC055071]